MIWLFTAINIFNYLDRYLVAAVLPLLMAEFALSNEEAGRLQSAFVIGYVIFSPIFGYLGDRWSRPKLMALGVFLWSLATFGSGLCTAFSILFLVRVCVGIGEASFGTSAPGFIKDRLGSPEKVNAALSIFFSAIPVGAALGYVIGGYLSSKFGWRTTFYVCGIPGMILAFALLKFRECRSSVPNESLTERVTIREGLREIVGIRALWFGIGGYILNAFALNGIATFIVPFGMIYGLSQAEVNQYFGLILVATGLLGTLGGGRISTYFANRAPDPIASMFRFIGVLAIIAAPVLALGLAAESSGVFLTFCFFAELLIFAGVAPVNSIIVLTCPPKYITLTQGVTILAINLLGAFLAPILIGFAADKSSLPIGMQMASVALALSGVVWLMGGSGPRRSAAGTADIAPGGAKG